MNAPSPTTDIRVGDLVKATLKEDGESTWTARVRRVTQRSVDAEYFGGSLRLWGFEVVDRPLPPIDEELLNEVTAIWRNPLHRTVADALTAIIHHVTEHNNKESK